MPEDRYRDLVLNGKKAKRLSYLDEMGNYIQREIKLKDEISVSKLDTFFNEIYKGTRYSYSISASEVINFFKDILNNQSVIDLTRLYKIIISNKEVDISNGMLLQFFQDFLEMFENINTIIWTNEQYNMFVTISQRQPKLDDPIFKAEKQSMVANSNILYCINQIKNKQIVTEMITKIKVKSYNAQARR